MLSTIGQVRAAEAEEGQDILLEGVEGRLQLRGLVLCRLFRGRQGAKAGGHRVAAEVPLCLVSLVRQAKAVLRQP